MTGSAVSSIVPGATSAAAGGPEHVTEPTAYDAIWPKSPAIDASVVPPQQARPMVRLPSSTLT